LGRRGRFNLTDDCILIVTTTVVEFTRVGTNDTYCDLLITEYYLLLTKNIISIVLAYVIMPLTLSLDNNSKQTIWNNL
jgi:hypothetical protein